MNYRQKMIQEFKEILLSHGFIVRIAASGESGSYTDSDKCRVISFEVPLGVLKVSGNYDPRAQCGTGWVIDNELIPNEFTKESLTKLLYTQCPQWANKNPTYTPWVE